MPLWSSSDAPVTNPGPTRVKFSAKDSGSWAVVPIMGAWASILFSGVLIIVDFEGAATPYSPPIETSWNRAREKQYASAPLRESITIALNSSEEQQYHQDAQHKP